MILLRRPSLPKIEAFLAAAKDGPFSYAPVGGTAGPTPPGYARTFLRAPLGRGDNTFRRAVEAMRRWEMFRLNWVQIHPPAPPVEPGSAVCVVGHHMGFYTLNAARVVYGIDEPRRFGFAYGTLEDHIERGEERFLIERTEDDTVEYELLSFSRPAHWLAWTGYPMARRVQRRFARESAAALRRSIEGSH